MKNMAEEERTESYGHSLVIAKKVVEIEGRFVEVRLLEMEYGERKRIVARCRWANRDALSIRKSYEKGFEEGKKWQKKKE
ncbi:hypothetical protein LCGC14_0439100 [marine sediment metagenome]|uniref:Uncharacterized protein n=1 Tax=marine sediment metagenome TaxID=412755 RepID=A0A0F9T410_9ZZZZ